MIRKKITYCIPEKTDINNMKYLWIDVFKDTEKYVDLVFENYVDERNCIVAFDGEKLVAMLIGLPYDFKICNQKMRGLYLCGLSTLPTYRGRGIMSDMLNMVSDICRNNNYSFCFLIPADTRLREYYSRFGFLNTALLNRYDVSRINFNWPKVFTDIYELTMTGHKDEVYIRLAITDDNPLNILSIADIDSLIIRTISSCLEKFENEKSGNHILHSIKDWKIVIVEKLLSGWLLGFTKNLDEIFMFDSDGHLDILRGDLSHISNILKGLYLFMLKDEEGSSIVIEAEKRSGIYRNINIETGVSQELYGMIRFEDDTIEDIASKFKGPENRIFQTNRDKYGKYAKMNFEKISEESLRDLASSISFAYMLD